MSLIRAIGRKVKGAIKNRNYRKWVFRFNQTHSTRVSADAKIDENTELEKHVRLDPGCDFRGSIVGRHTYAGNGSKLPNSVVGRFTSIADGCRLIMFTHPIHFVSTWPGFFHTINSPDIIKHFNDSTPFFEYLHCQDGRSVHIGNDVWIGQNVTIKNGVTIGDGAVIGANALVTKDVPPYAIVGGVPAKIIRYRFSPEEIQFLLSVRWWEWDDQTIELYSPCFQSLAKFHEKLDLEAAAINQNKI
ncbi:MAG: CatB-related O-acetyltransferase [Bacilli bacterium]|nr:CatB-related O-acetyltransferase [Bacilli bacterium]